MTIAGRFVSSKFTNNLLRRSIQWRRTYAVPVPSHVPKAHKGQKRVSKDERRAMVEFYVNKYREKHAGKFPCPSQTLKEVGGSYYVIRQLLQEIEYKSKIVTSKVTAGATQCDPHTVALNNLKVDSSGKHVEAKEETQDIKKIFPEEAPNVIISTNNLKNHSNLAGIKNSPLEEDSCPLPENTQDGGVKDNQINHSDFVETSSHIDDQSLQNLKISGNAKAQHGYHDSVASESRLHNFNAEIVSDPCHEKVNDDQKEHSELVDLMDPESQKQKDKPLEVDEKDMARKQINDAEHPKKSTIWGNLKTFADGIINLWRKQ